MSILSKESNQNRLSCLYRQISLWLLGCAIVLRLFLPGLTVEMGENALIWLFAWGAFLFVVIDSQSRTFWGIKSIGLTLSIIFWISLSFLSVLWAKDKVQSLYQSMIWLSDILLFFTICYWGRNIRAYLLAILLSCFTLEIVYSLYQYFIGLPALRFYVQQNSDVLKELNLPPYLLKFFHVKLHIPHIFGHFTLTNSLGGYLILYLPILVGLCFWNRWKQRFFLGILFILALITLWMTASRGSMLSLILALGFYGIYYAFFRGNRKKLLALALWILLLSLIIFYGSLYTHHLDFIGTHSLTLVMRVAYWDAGVRIWLDHLATGVGVGNFQYYYYTYKIPWAEEVNKLHNCYLQWIVETGLPGIFILGFLLYHIISWLSRKDSQENFPCEEFNSSCKPYFLLFIFSMGFAFLLLSLLGRSFELDPLFYWLKSKNVQSSFIPYIISLLPYLVVVVAIILSLSAYIFFIQIQTGCISTAIKIGLLAYALHNFLDIDFYDPTLSQQFWIFLAIMVCKENSTEGHYKVNLPVKIISLTVVSGIALWFGVYKVPDLIRLIFLQRSLHNLQNQLANVRNSEEYNTLWSQYEQEVEQVLKIAPWEDKFKAIQTINQLREIKNFVRRHTFSQLRLENMRRLLYQLEKDLEDRISYKPRNIASWYALTSFFLEQAEIWNILNLQKEYLQTLAKAEKSCQKLLMLYPRKAKFLILAGEIAEKQQSLKAGEYYHHALYLSDLDPGELEDSEKKKLKEKVAAYSKQDRRRHSKTKQN